MKIQKYMQITVKPGIHIQVGVTGKAEYKNKKMSILSCKKKFVDVIDTCTLKRQDIVAIEYFEQEAKADEN